MDTSTVSSTTATSGLSTYSASAAAELDENYDLFLSILTTQLETQSPLDPVDTEEMTSQLIQYSQVEQQILTNQYLESLVLSTNEQSAETALGFLGKDVTYNASGQDYSGSDVTWTMEVPEDAESLTLEIFNENGLKVYETVATPGSDAFYDFVWNGATTSSGVATSGYYYLAATTTMPDGSTSTIALQSTSRANEVVWSSGEPKLVLANGATIGLDEIISAAVPETYDA